MIVSPTEVAMEYLLDLWLMRTRWYASYRDGNTTRNGPTHFPPTMTKEEVIGAIKTSTPGIIISLKD